MSWSFRIARIAGIDIRIHFTFFLLLAWIGYAFYSRGGAPAMWQGIIFILALFLCVLLHELGHAFAAARYGIKTPDITLLPIGGLARLQRMPDHPVQELVVAVAGPLVNVVIAVAITLGIGAAAGFSPDVQLDNPRVPMLLQLRNVNILLVLFNLIPAFPMDGGRVLRALLAMRISYGRATAIAAGVGQFMAFLFALWGLLAPNPLLLLIALFVYMGATQEAAFTQMREAARNASANDAMITDFHMLPATATLGDAVDALLSTSQREFPITDDAGAVVGVLTREDLIAGLRQSDAAAPVSGVMRSGVPTVRAGSSLEEAFRIMAEGSVPLVMVLDRLSKPIGMITAENVGELMMVQSALEGRPRAAWSANNAPVPRESAVRPA
ncbi:MAG TPA: site-2 protease family protein [Tepidisphaeraceae bacterium]|nr:site-2 protease family protein [Tepidisphaeraceae bacterium]